MTRREELRPRLLLLLPTTTYRAQAFVEAAHRLDVELTVASERDSAFSDQEQANLITLDLRDPDRAVTQIAEFAERHPIDAVFGVDDDTGVVAAAVSGALGLPHNSRSAMEAARDKYRQRMLLRSAGVPVPAFELRPLSVARSPISFPCVVKPLHLSASRGVIRADDSEQFASALDRLRSILESADVVAQVGRTEHFLVEAFVPGPEFALEGLLVEGELHVLALFDKPDPMDGPYFEETIYVTPSRHPKPVHDALVLCAARATRALGLERGPVHVELRYNGEGPWLIELAARPIGGKCGQVLRFGPDEHVSLEELLLGHALGLTKELPAREPSAVGVMMLPVPEAGTFREVKGIQRAAAVPGVRDIVVAVHPGQELVPLPEESRYLGFVFARGDSPAAAEAAIRAAYDCLEIVLE